jgi:hypothetical protein
LFASQLAIKAADSEWFPPNACKSARRLSTELREKRLRCQIKLRGLLSLNRQPTETWS